MSSSQYTLCFFQRKITAVHFIFSLENDWWGGSPGNNMSKRNDNLIADEHFPEDATYPC